MINECRTESDLDRILEASHKKPVFLLKHSTACGISMAAQREFSRFVEKTDRAEFWQVLVRENKPVSLTIARKTGIQHQSPQVILFSDGRAVWNESHWDITVDALQEQLRVRGRA